MTPSSPQTQCFAYCVKGDSDYFSLQHGLQYISGGRLGNGWVSGALLGSSVSAGIGFVQSLFGGNAGGALSAGAGEALSRAGGPAAVRAAASVPDELALPWGIDIPLGAIARTGADVLDFGLRAIGQVKDPYDLTVSSFSAIVCSTNY